MAFCVSCGESLPAAPAPGAQPPPPVAPPPYAYGAPYGAPAPAPAGPRGRVQAPGLVVVLSLVTLGIYAAVYWWRVSREVDERMQRPPYAHKMARWGILLVVAAGVAYLVGVGAMFAAIAGSMDPVTGEPSTDVPLGLLWTIPLMLAAWAAGIAGYVLLIIGEWRVWTFLQTEDMRRMRPQPFNPGLMLVLTLVPLVNLVGVFIALYSTQERLNEHWQAA